MSFDPFNDRLSRDIRNDLSEKFIAALTSADRSSLDEILETWRHKARQPCYGEYIQNRRILYGEAFREIDMLPDRNLYAITRILWNRSLFFELHEYLEGFWIRTVDQDEKLLLQALIRAAGAYVHLQGNRKESAAKMAAKAVPVLHRSRHRLDRFYANADIFIRGLEELAFPQSELLPK